MSIIFTDLQKFFKVSVSPKIAEEQAALDKHVFGMHEYISFNDPAQVLRFLELYARKAQDVAVQPRLDTVLGNLANAGYSDDITKYDMNNPASVAQFAVSSLIRDMKRSNLPPYPQAVENKKRLYFQSLDATQSLDA